MPSGLILVADGEASSGGATARLLRQLGHDVVAVTDGVEAIAELHGAEFDVAVLEVTLGGRGAFEVIAAAHHLSPDTEIIVVAREPQLATALECLRLGIFDLLEKNACAEALAATVARALERRRLRATTTLYRASQEIFTSQNPEKLPATIVAIAARVLEADDVTLALPGRDGRMTTVHSHSLSATMRREVSVEVGDDVAEAVARLGDAALLPEDDGWKVEARLSRVRSSIVFPMSSGERHVGVLTVSRIADPRPYRRADVERTSVLASQVLLAVENAALVRRTIDAERLATIGQLSAGVAHEINNPLTYILASGDDAREQIELLRAAAHDEGPEAVAARVAQIMLIADALADVCDGGRRIAEIAGDLRTLARGNAPSCELVELSDAVRSAARVAGPRVRETATLDLDLGEETTMSGHAGRLTQVFVNLIVNAAQAGNKRGRPLAIVVRTRRIDGRVVASVIDDGPGIAPEHLDLLFQPFFSTKSASMGTGLGLSLTQSIVAEHSGTIGVASELGKGATFTVSFPAAAAAEQHADGPRSTRRPTRLVFVDGERATLRAYERWFGRDHDVVTLESGAEAVRLLTARAEVGAVVCDLETGGLRGREIYDQVCRARPELAGKFVFVSGDVVDPDNRAFLASCARPLLAKP
ncbi:MAG TPA: ATP-binding protein, partial [Labilithrix sp.]|nr:ATP-binding protein [Labilithrix sp.]